MAVISNFTNENQSMDSWVLEAKYNPSKAERSMV